MCTLSGNANQYSRHYKYDEGPSNNLKVELPHNPAISVLSIYLKQTKTLISIHTHTHTHWSITQPWKIKSNLALCDNMNGSRGHYSKWNKWNRKINTTWSHLHVEYENKTKWNRLIDTESKGTVTREGMVKGIKRHTSKSQECNIQHKEYG